MTIFKCLMRAGIGFAALGGTVLAGSSPALAQQISVNELPGFHLDFEAANARQSIKEYVPEGESVDDWSRMVTIQQFNGVAHAITPTDFVSRLVTMMKANCPGATSTEVESLTISGRAAAETRLDCPINPSTGEPETMFARVISGDADLHSVQVAFRSVPTEKEAAWAEDYLDSVSLR